jgi:dTDP-glucose 4,6-dehydratase
VVNLGSGFEISIGDTLNLIAELMKVQVKSEEEAVRLRPAKSEVNRLFADNSKALRLWGWQPAYGKLEGFRKGLTETITWFSDPGNLNAYKHDRYTI